MVYIINIDASKVFEMDVDSYFENAGGMMSAGMPGL
jgi:hypothetical protein